MSARRRRVPGSTYRPSTAPAVPWPAPRSRSSIPVVGGSSPPPESPGPARSSICPTAPTRPTRGERASCPRSARSRSSAGPARRRSSSRPPRSPCPRRTRGPCPPRRSPPSASARDVAEARQLSVGLGRSGESFVLLRDAVRKEGGSWELHDLHYIGVGCIRRTDLSVLDLGRHHVHADGRWTGRRTHTGHGSSPAPAAPGRGSRSASASSCSPSEAPRPSSRPGAPSFASPRDEPRRHAGRAEHRPARRRCRAGRLGSGALDRSWRRRGDAPHRGGLHRRPRADGLGGLPAGGGGRSDQGLGSGCAPTRGRCRRGCHGTGALRGASTHREHRGRARPQRRRAADHRRSHRVHAAAGPAGRSPPRLRGTRRLRHHVRRDPGAASDRRAST